MSQKRLREYIPREAKRKMEDKKKYLQRPAKRKREIRNADEKEKEKEKDEEDKKGEEKGNDFEISSMIFNTLLDISFKLENREGTITTAENIMIRDEFLEIGPNKRTLTEMFFNEDEPMNFYDYIKKAGSRGFPKKSEINVIIPYLILLYYNINPVSGDDCSKIFPSTPPLNSLEKTESVSKASNSLFMRTKRRVISSVTPFKLHFAKSINHNSNFQEQELSNKVIDQVFSLIFTEISGAIKKIIMSLNYPSKWKYIDKILKGTIKIISDLHDWKVSCVENTDVSSKKSEKALQTNMEYLLRHIKLVSNFNYHITIESEKIFNKKANMSLLVRDFVIFTKSLFSSSSYRYNQTQKLPKVVNEKGEDYRKPPPNLDCDICLDLINFEQRYAFCRIGLKTYLSGVNYCSFIDGRNDISNSDQDYHDFGSEYTKSIDYIDPFSDPLEYSEASRTVQELHKQNFSYMAVNRFISGCLSNGTNLSLLQLNKVQFRKMIDSEKGHLNIITFHDIVEQLENIFESWADEKSTIFSLNKLKEFQVSRALEKTEQKSDPCYNSYTDLKTKATKRLRLLYKSDENTSNDESESLNTLKSYLVEYIFNHYCFKTYINNSETQTDTDTDNRYDLSSRKDKIKTLWKDIENNYNKLQARYDTEILILPVHELLFRNNISTTSSHSMTLPLQSIIFFYLLVLCDLQKEEYTDTHGKPMLEQRFISEDLDHLLQQERRLLNEKIKRKKRQQTVPSGHSGPAVGEVDSSDSNDSGSSAESGSSEGSDSSGGSGGSAGPSADTSRAPTTLGKHATATQTTGKKKSVSGNISIPTPPRSSPTFPIVKSYEEEAPLIGKKVILQDISGPRTITLGSFGCAIQDSKCMYQVYKVETSDIIKLFPALATEGNFKFVPKELIWKVYDHISITEWYEENPVYIDVFPTDEIIEEKYNAYIVEVKAYELIQKHNKEVTASSERFIHVPNIYYCGNYRIKRSNFRGRFLLMDYLKPDFEFNRQNLNSFPRNKREEILNDCIKLVRNLNSIGIRHRDLKFKNFVISGGKVHLIDFSDASVGISSILGVYYEVEEGDIHSMKGMLMQDDEILIF